MIPEYLFPLANHLWQSTLVAGVAVLLTLLLRKNSARVLYSLWFVASLKFLIPFSLLMSFGHRLEWHTPSAITQQSFWTVAQMSMPFEATPAIPQVPATATARNPVPVILLAVWLCGFGVSLLGWMRSWRQVRTALRAATPVDVDLHYSDASVEVMSSPILMEPAVFGILTPVLLLPEGITDRLTKEQLTAVLVHELCHVRRRDNLATGIYMVAETIFWFYPLVRWIGKRLINERERACDEEVLRLGYEPLVYAEGILNVCKSYVESPLHCAAGVTGSDLKSRIGTILNGCLTYELNFAKKVTLVAAATWAVGMPIILRVFNASPMFSRPQNNTRAENTPKWEAVSIKPCVGGQDNGGRGRGGGAGPSPGRLNMPCFPVKFFIQSAYDLFASGHGFKGAITPNSRTVPIEGGPSWINSDLYEITAKAEGIPTNEVMRGPMLQVLLEDRFHLKIHRETRDMPVYALTVAKGGSKLTPFEEGSCFTPQPGTSPSGPPGKFHPCGGVMFLRNGALQTLEMWGMSLAEISQNLGWNVVDRQVIDKTGIAGTFNIHLEFAPDTATPGAVPGRDGVPGGVGGTAASDPSGPSIFTAIQEQLGLKLEATRGLGYFLVIDSIERPTEN